ncbi:thiamine diphosphokinase [Roseovarius sp. B08]|uniref:thiamine diphosphokinase n=1 Tax=Roseovarius sp. B08 TaxID=3449223 RepID=UPI003EDC8F66
MIVHQLNPVTLVGGGQLGENDLKRAIAVGNHVVAADGGADSVKRAGLVPSAVIGDFDSLSDETRATLSPDRLYHISEQDSTDFEKCLRNVDAPLILGVGFTGRRIDHHLANLNALVRYPHRRCILLDGTDIVFLAPPSIALDLPPGTPVSLFPLGIVEGMSEGLEWPISGLTFTPDGRVGTSNRATGPVSLHVTAPKMLLILPATAFEAAVDVLLQNAATWSATASTA